jgi:membrane protein insertase Oxa1/YidC/SpoIIIJ
VGDGVEVEMGAGAVYPASLVFTRLVAVTTIPLAATLPAGVLVFWTTSNAFAVVRGAAVRSDAVRRALRIPLQSALS